MQASPSQGASRGSNAVGAVGQGTGEKEHPVQEFQAKWRVNDEGGQRGSW